MTRSDFLALLPAMCHGASIAPGKRTSLGVYYGMREIWAVLLTDMSGDTDKAWRLTHSQWEAIHPKHGSKARWVRENITPTVQRL